MVTDKQELYNRVSCRSPLRRDQRIIHNQQLKNQPNIPNTNNLNNTNNLSTTNNLNSTNNLNTNNLKASRQTSRTVKRNIKPKEDDVFYKVVTQTPSGQTVKVPTTLSFIKLKPQPISQIHYIPMKNTKYHFTEALDLFENNQSYLLQELEKGQDIRATCQELYTWFNKIKEPKPKKSEDVIEWKERQEFQKKNGYSSYWDKELRPYLQSCL
jgi:hypothetical protein